jgi:Tfp pilus assembly protein PilF
MAEGRPGKSCSVTLLLLLTAVWLEAASAAPFIPREDSQVLERLPFKPGDSVSAELRSMRAQLAKEPSNHEVATRLARRYYQLAQAEGDPRFVGYAQAVLGAWWNMAEPPVDVLLMRATIRQYNHDFQTALADLSRVIGREPRNARAWASRMVIHTVWGNYDEAHGDCERLQELADELVATACYSTLDGLMGRARLAYEKLSAVLDKQENISSQRKLVVLTLLAEMAERLDQVENAEKHYKQALGLRITDNYLLARYADFLLDQGRPGEVVTLLKDKAGSDVLLLRLALAERAVKSAAATQHQAVLSARFDAARSRGDKTHLREESRFALSFLHQPRKALELAIENWKLQREPNDARVLLEAALAAGDPQAAKPALDWLTRTHYEDPHLNRLAQRLRGARP